MSAPSFPIASAPHVRLALARIVRAHRARIALVVVLFGASSVAGLIPPWLIGRLIDRVGAGADLAEVTVIGSVMLASVAAQAAGVLLATRITMALGEGVFAELREDFVGDALFLPLDLVERAGTGDLVNRTTQDVGAVSSTVRFAIPQMLVASVTILLTITGALVVSPVIAPVFLLAGPILLVALRWYLPKAPAAYLAEGAAFGPMLGSVGETFDGARTVDALRLAERRDAATDAALDGYWRATVPVIRLHMVLYPWTNVAFAVPVAAALAWGGWLATQGIVSIGAIVTVTLYATQFAAPLETIVRWVDELQGGLAAFARVLGVGEARSNAEIASLLPDSQELRLEDVRFAYRQGHDVLHGVTLTVAPGERLAIVGPSGAGKSTLARLLAGLDTPQSGRALVGGVPLSTLPLERRRREVLLVTQENHVFAATIGENVRLGDVEATETDVLRALDTVGARDWALEVGLHTVVGAGGAPLSGAQEQQLALARIVLAGPHTLVLDEATSLMDPAQARTLEAALAAVLRGRTVIAIAHRLHTAFDADRIVVVDAGRIVEVGSHAELLERHGAYARLWRAWRET
jgi:ABC-type multidrug transport system fused ATPase/permease subunit